MRINCAVHIARNLFACLLLMLSSACHEPDSTIMLSGPAMGTTYTIKIVPTNAIEPAVVRATAEEVLAEIDRQMSTYRVDSEISRFNDSRSTDWIAVSPELATVVARSLAVGKASSGALDITVAPLVELWGFGPRGGRTGVPTETEMQQVRTKVGYERLHVCLETLSLRKDVGDLRIDLNAVAPGYAVDALAARFARLGLQSFMIELGGEVFARGRNAHDAPWRIAVEQPVDYPSAPYALVALSNAAIATSGDYRHYYSYEGRRYSHTIDPRAGSPVQHAAGAVVVIASSTFDADAWATAFNVLGPDVGHALAAQLRMPVMFVVRDGARLVPRMTPEFARYVSVPPS